ncbi:hypothetical protein ACH5RR_007961 [Cinchona calisaya]|uniref:Uncharacterized protein n=1 Tax=Cinchona calisaya TaxID=153742 RepID=A0ABD3AAD5_9GENT
MSNLSEPLLHKVHVQKCIDLSQVSFFRKLSFSWINPLLRVGNTKTLALEDIPCLGSEDEAILAYEKFAHAWTLLEKGKNLNSVQNPALWALARVYRKERCLQVFMHCFGQLLLYLLHCCSSLLSSITIVKQDVSKKGFSYLGA